MADTDGKFKTHIEEPHWQQVASVIFVLGVFAVWIWLVFH